MHKLDHSVKFCEILVIAFCLILTGVSCTPLASATPTAMPLIQTVEVTRLVTRIVEVPVTVTPAVTLQPAVSKEALPGLAGKWIDPDSSGGGTVSTIVWQDGTYVVTSVVNSNRGGNEIKTSSWSNGVLSWEYCPPSNSTAWFRILYRLMVIS